MTGARAVRVGVLGAGVVGSQVVRLLTEQADELAARVGAKLDLVAVAVRRPGRHPEIPADILTTDAAGLVARDDIDVVVEVIGGIEPTKDLLLTALRRGAGVVTANKALLAEYGPELYEAADVDGASTMAKFWSVTVPGVRPATALVVILATITGMNLFTEPYLLTNGGGPNGASVTPVFYMYQKGVEQGQAGYAAAIGMILLAITLLIALVQRRLLERD